MGPPNTITLGGVGDGSSQQSAITIWKELSLGLFVVGALGIVVGFVVRRRKAWG